MMSTRENQPLDAESEALAQAKAESEPTDDVAALEPAEIESPAEPDVTLDKLQARARKLPPEELSRILESLLFVSPGPLTAEAVERATGIAPDVAAKHFGELIIKYQNA